VAQFAQSTGTSAPENYGMEIAHPAGGSEIVMEKETIRAMAGSTTHSRLWTMVLCGVAGIALAVPVVAKDQAAVLNPGGPVDFFATVSALREVPVGGELPGLHLDVKVKGHTMDVYVAPMDFVAKYGVNLAKGDEVHVVGMQTETNVVLARQITTGTFDNSPRGGGAFRADTTVYLRGDDGPFWVEEVKPGPRPVAAH